MRSRAHNRHHRERIKRNRTHWWGRNLSADKKALGMVLKTPTPCSCAMCCNRRKIEGVTIQEKKHPICIDDLSNTKEEEG